MGGSFSDVLPPTWEATPVVLRFMQIFVPQDTDLDELLEGHEILGTWRDAMDQDRLVVHLLVPAEETEPITDRFEQAFSDVSAFRVVLFPVEAVLPRPHAHDEPASTADEVEEAEQTVKQPGRVSREELYTDIVDSFGLSRVFLAMTVLSSLVAAVGLMRDDVAVLIGAMVIAPLLGPNVALALATTLGDTGLLRRAGLTNLAGMALTLLLPFGIGLVLTVDPAVPAIASRTDVSMADVVLALAAGSAGTFAFTRGLSGAVIGVMVAVALMPPLVAFGMLLGSGHVLLALRALALIAVNFICINLAGVATFLAQGLRPRTWWEEERAKRAARIAVVTWIVLLAALGAILAWTHAAGYYEVSYHGAIG
jgi:uncharacterized hydrophobic protein (TIGR00341 family)